MKSYNERESFSDYKKYLWSVVNQQAPKKTNLDCMHTLCKTGLGGRSWETEVLECAVFSASCVCVVTLTEVCSTESVVLGSQAQVYCLHVCFYNDLMMSIKCSTYLIKEHDITIR